MSIVTLTGSSRSARCCRSPRRRITSTRPRERDPARRLPTAAQRDERLRPEIQRVWRGELRASTERARSGGSCTAKGIAVARCTVERLMRAMGLRGVVRGRACQHDRSRPTAAQRPLDRVKRQFKATRPNQLWVADFTYVATWQRLRLCRLRHRRVRPPHRRLAGQRAR